MKLITIENKSAGMMLPKAWISLVSFVRQRALGCIIYIPWIFNGPYYDPMSRLNRYGWRIPRILFEIRLEGQFIIRRRWFMKWYQTIFIIPKLRFYKFYWYEAI